MDDLTILMAEDDPGHASLIRRHIQRAGVTHEILHFQDGQAVMDFLRSAPREGVAASPYVLLLDIRMPKMDGLEVLEQIKTDDRLRSIPVVMLTTTADPATKDRCYQLGCDDYIVKQTSVEQFAAVITKLGQTLKGSG